MIRSAAADRHLATDVLIVGGGVAGMSLALRLAEAGRHSLLLTKSRLTESSSLYAQGGIAAVLSADDTLDAHVEDTLNAGAGLCRREVVEMVVERGPAVIRWLIDRGVTFSMFHDDAGIDVLHLTREGGHSHRRVIHSEDATGRSVTTTLGTLVRASERIDVLEDHIAIDLIDSARIGLDGPRRCVGLYAYDIRNRRPMTIAAQALVLATGGASKVYLYTSNPDISTGDGIAMAWRAGCRVANMEFVQFHPTCLYHPHAKSFLISEAVRGEGGRLVLDDGHRFMPEHDPRAELAPRDIVARAIDYEMKRRGLDCVYLDISHKPADFIRQHFPNIHRRCLEYGIDMTRQPVPVVPAAHYTCGGIVTGLHGDTDVDRLYAIGECAMTGLHGANRLASNSLLECLVFAESAAEHIVRTGAGAAIPRLPTWDESRVTDPDEQIVVSHNWDELRHFMWDYVGIVRTNKRLQRAANRLRLLDEEIREFYSNFKVSNDLIELRNLVLVADLIVRCATQRRESRGLHYNLDFPSADPAGSPADTVLTP